MLSRIVHVGKGDKQNVREQACSTGEKKDEATVNRQQTTQPAPIGYGQNKSRGCDLVKHKSTSWIES
jgi:hypothetical protein